MLRPGLELRFLQFNDGIMTCRDYFLLSIASLRTDKRLRDVKKPAQPLLKNLLFHLKTAGYRSSSGSFDKF